MPQPRLTFFCELELDELRALFDRPGVVAELQALQAGISLGLLDLSSRRAEVVRRLNAAGIPVTAWLLLPKEQGYYSNQDNAFEAKARYEDFRDWSRQEGLTWAAIGLDIEPDLRVLEGLAAHPWRSLPKLLRRAVESRRFSQAQAAYSALVKEIRADGFHLESYQYPIIADERKAGSNLLRRVTGLVDLRADREIWMLYSSLSRPLGVGVLWAYGPEAQAIGIGNTGAE